MTGNNSIDTKAIKDLEGMNFFIPNYQRGYRWTEQQVKDLLNDVNEFEPNDNNWYCLQPLTVKKILNENAIDNIAKLFSFGKKPDSTDPIKKELEDKWEVIDGQQRLTTIFIILQYLSPKSHIFSIEYETRQDSKDFLINLNKSEGNKSEENIDYYHISKAYETVRDWFKKHDAEEKEYFKNKILNNVKIIWYETAESEPIKVFTRLNIGKIPLTNSELIKALLLNSSNFKEDNSDDSKIRLRQQEIAAQWDNIEYTLQNDEFWLFIHDLSYNSPTRIDFIFDLICEDKKFGAKEDLGTDEYKTFRYFFFAYNNFKDKNDALKTIWGEVKKRFQTFKNWYDDLELYHYIGYLIEQNWKLSTLYSKWSEEKQTKIGFIDKLKDEIKEAIFKCSNLDQEYEIPGHPKTQCKPLLLLYNIQTVINQNKALKSADKYKLSAFYKFPFHLYKKEGKKASGKGWEVEHIASNAGDIEDPKNEQIYLASIKYAEGEKSELSQEIDKYFTKEREDKKIIKEISEKYKGIADKDKNKICNFALLDSTTNEEYRNSVFPIKRICINGKDKGKKIRISFNEQNKSLRFSEEEGIAFVPPCTKNVFAKSYTEVPDALNSWTEKDAEAYKNDIYETLKGFEVKLEKGDESNG